MNIINKLESFVNDDNSGMTAIYREAIEELRKRDEEILKAKLENAKVEVKAGKVKAALDHVIKHCQVVGIHEPVHAPIVFEALRVEISNEHINEYVMERFELVGKIVNESDRYMGNIKANLGHETALFALKGYN